MGSGKAEKGATRDASLGKGKTSNKGPFEGERVFPTLKDKKNASHQRRARRVSPDFFQVKILCLKKDKWTVGGEKKLTREQRQPFGGGVKSQGGLTAHKE